MKHFLHGRVQLAENALCPPPPPPDALKVAPFDSAAAGTQIEVVKQGDKVTRLIVTCSCGERIEIDCLYSAS
jgi:hypothetical protein